MTTGALHNAIRKGPSWLLPMEAIRGQVRVEDIEPLIRVECQRLAEFLPHQEVELTPAGFVAHLRYRSAKYGGREDCLTVTLVWPVRENGL